MNDKPIYPVFEERRFVGRVTKNPYLGNGMAAVSLAINHSYKDDEDGRYKQVDPVYEDVLVFDDDNYRFIQDNVHTGTVVEVFGRVQYKKRKGYVNRNIVINDRQPEHYIRLATPLARSNAGGVAEGRKASKAPTTTQRRGPGDPLESDEITF